MDLIRQILRNIILTLCSAMLAAACSVKEERLGCPCYLALHVEDFYTAGMKKATVRVSTESSLVCRESLELGLFADAPYFVEVPRRMNYVSMAGGFGVSCFLDGDILKVKDGEMPEPVMAFTGEVACLGDNAELRPVPHKQFCRVTIVVTGKAQGEEHPFRYRVNYPCNAMDISSLKPLDGKGSFVIEENYQSSMGFMLLRQNGQDISIDVLEGVSETGYEQVSTINLSGMLAKHGYDWTKPDLDDAVLTIDYSHATVSIDIEPWTHVFLEYDS